MKRFFAAGLFLALSACGPAAAPTSAPSATTPDATANGKPSATAPMSLTPAMLVGRWGDNGDCTKDIVLNDDGTFRSYAGGGGTWSLRGDRMTMNGANGTFEVGVSVLNQRTLVITNPDGSVGTSQRC